MQKYIALLLFLITGLIVSTCPVMAAGSHTEPKKQAYTEETEYTEETGGGGSHAVTDDVIFNNIVQPVKVIWNWCLTTKVRLGSHSFSFANFFLWQILAVIAVWFLRRRMYD